MKAIGNVAGLVDITRPLTNEEIERALSKKGPTLRQVAKAGYGLEIIQPTAFARTCAGMFGRRIKPIPRFLMGGS